MIFTERTITVVNDSATINKPLILYRGDKNIELKITIAESQFKFRNTDASNVIETTDASYAQLVINTPYNSPIFSDVAVTKNGAVIFVITEAMIDEIREVGAYEIQIRLLDDNKQSRASIPPVSNAIEIREPIAIEDGSTVDSNAVNVAKVNRALTTTSAPLEAFDSQGNYIKKTWGDGDPITDAALNKMEAGIDGVNNKISNVSSQIKEKANKNEIFTMANMGQDVKEAMTGGSVAVVGKNAVLNENIVDGQVTPGKTNFMELDTTLNLFDGYYKTNVTIDSTYKYATSDELRKVAFIKVKPNTTYSIIRESSSLFRVATHTSEVINLNETFNGSVKSTWGTPNLHATITTGENDVLLAIQTTYTGETPFMQIVEGTQTDFTISEYPFKYKFAYNKNETYTKEEVNNLIPSIPNESRKVKIVKTSNCLDIYVPSKKNSNYLHYKYCLVNNPNINMNCWRVLSMNVVDSTFNIITPWIQDCEWEGVLQEKDTADFLGGFHGDETYETINVIIDGNEVDLDGSDFTLEVNNKIIITVKSTLNRCNTPGDNLLTRYKISTWDKDNYIVENKWIALQTFTLIKCYPTMLSMMKEDSNGNDIISWGRYDYDYFKTPSKGSVVEGCVVNRKDVKVFEFWGQTSGVYTKVESIYDNKYPNRKQFASRNQQPNIFKAYFDLTGEYTVAKGEVLQGKSIYTIDI